MVTFIVVVIIDSGVVKPPPSSSHGHYHNQLINISSFTIIVISDTITSAITIILL